MRGEKVKSERCEVRSWPPDHLHLVHSVPDPMFAESDWTNPSIKPPLFECTFQGIRHNFLNPSFAVRRVAA
jgi:hypothetical protein